jgi:hypothetical protein
VRSQSVDIRNALLPNILTFIGYKSEILVRIEVVLRDTFIKLSIYSIELRSS